MSLVIPSMERAVACRIDMDIALAESARTLLEARGHFLAACVDGAATDRIDALDYGSYCDLAFAGDALDADARMYAVWRLATRLPDLGREAIERLARAGVGARPVVRALSPEHFSPAEIACMVRWWDNEPANHLALSPPDAVEFAEACRTVGFAMDRLRDCAPDLFAEMTAIVRDIVIASSGASARMAFGGGATSFALWGSLLADPVSEPRWLQMYRILAHETAHNLLFALARKEPLVANDPSERFTSPLRADLRPMDGIFHAAYVSMRESMALDALLSWHDESGALGQEDAADAFTMLEGNVVAFWDCDDILRRQASLTALGDAILSECEEFMQASFTLAPA